MIINIFNLSEKQELCRQIARPYRIHTDCLYNNFVKNIEKWYSCPDKFILLRLKILHAEYKDIAEKYELLSNSNVRLLFYEKPYLERKLKEAEEKFNNGILIGTFSLDDKGD